MHIGVLLTKGTFIIPSSWLLLETCSTGNVANNPNIMQNIRACKSEERLTAYCNGGKQVYNLMATLIFFH